MSFEALQERLTALQETTTQLNELIERLATLNFQPGSVPLTSGEENDDDSDNVSTELSGEISQILREEEEDLEVLQEEITDLRSGRPGSQAEHSKARLRDGAARLDGELARARVASRSAQLAARRNLLAAQRQERALLLASYASTPPTRSGATSPELDGPPNTTAPADGGGGGRQQLFPPGYVPPHKRRRHKPGDDADNPARDSDGNLVSASTDVTAALRRTHDLISAEVARSSFARTTLAESSAALARLGESYGTLEGLLAGSRDLVGVLLRSQKSDSWYLETALYALLATLGWLVFRRWLYGPLWWLVWFPLRTGVGWTLWAGRTAVAVGGGAGGASREVGGGAPGEQNRGRVRVEGIPEDVPTVGVAGKGQQNAKQGGDPDSMVEKVGKIVDGAAPDGDDTGVRNQSDDDRPRNPKKRMWEEDQEAAKEAQRAKDEL